MAHDNPVFVLICDDELERRSMNLQVEASTTRAGALFSDSRFLVPDFQRRYSWRPEEQVKEFWDDLNKVLGGGEYFLGLIILSEAEGRREVVDGQQRLITLTILANLIRLAAIRSGRRLVAESLRSDFLFAIDYETEEQVPRILLTDPSDKASLRSLLELTVDEAQTFSDTSLIGRAHTRIAELLEQDLKKSKNRALRLGTWAEFITKSLTFAVFTHPDRSAAFRVFEVVNTRGKALTPTELIKSHLIGTSEHGTRNETHSRWNSIENQFESASTLENLTTFVRHVVSLDRGFVIPRDLYDVVTEEYKYGSGVERLLDRLENYLPVYLQIMDPSSDVESSDVRTRAFAIADALSMTRLRPIFLAASEAQDADQLIEMLVELVVPGVLTGIFNTGNFEAQFARAARRLTARESTWPEELDKIANARPNRDEFEIRLLAGLNKHQVRVLRSAILQRSRLPRLSGFAHNIRPLRADGWEGFDDGDYRRIGNHLGNWLLLNTERRPQGTKDVDSVVSKLLPEAVDGEAIFNDRSHAWTAEDVERETRVLAKQAVEIWYSDE